MDEYINGLKNRAGKIGGKIGGSIGKAVMPNKAQAAYNPPGDWTDGRINLRPPVGDTYNLVPRSATSSEYLTNPTGEAGNKIMTSAQNSTRLGNMGSSTLGTYGNYKIDTEPPTGINDNTPTWYYPKGAGGGVAGIDFQDPNLENRFTNFKGQGIHNYYGDRGVEISQLGGPERISKELNNRRSEDIEAYLRTLPNYPGQTGDFPGRYVWKINDVGGQNQNVQQNAPALQSNQVDFSGIADAMKQDSSGLIPPPAGGWPAGSFVPPPPLQSSVDQGSSVSIPKKTEIAQKMSDPSLLDKILSFLQGKI